MSSTSWISSHVDANKDAIVHAVCSEISQQVRLLDGLVRYRFGDNAELMGAWASARKCRGAVPVEGRTAGG